MGFGDPKENSIITTSFSETLIEFIIDISIINVDCLTRRLKKQETGY